MSGHHDHPATTTDHGLGSANEAIRLGLEPRATAELAKEFGSFTNTDPIPRVERELVGAVHQRIVQDLVELAHDQWISPMRWSPLRGFLLSGPPGTGKTSIVKRVAYELSRRIDHVFLVIVDGGHIARSKYGDSEERIRALFRFAERQRDARYMILLDDVESVLMQRGSQHAKEWHFSQDSVFFHVIDELDPARTVVCLTTNRPDLVDDAIVDRFLHYRVEAPTEHQLMSAVAAIAERSGLLSGQRRSVERQISGMLDAGESPSFRHVERAVLLAHVEGRLGRPIGGDVVVR